MPSQEWQVWCWRRKTPASLNALASLNAPAASLASTALLLRARQRLRYSAAPAGPWGGGLSPRTWRGWEWRRCLEGDEAICLMGVASWWASRPSWMSSWAASWARGSRGWGHTAPAGCAWGPRPWRTPSSPRGGSAPPSGSPCSQSRRSAPRRRPSCIRTAPPSLQREALKGPT